MPTMDKVKDVDLQAAYAFHRATQDLIGSGIPSDIYYVKDMQEKILNYLSQKGTTDLNLSDQDLTTIEMGMWGAVHERRETTDDLTGFLNDRGARVVFLEKLARLSRHTNEPFGVVITDLKNFKFLNDNLGHLTGDNILRMIAQKMKKFARVGDSFWRMGGDEFAWILDVPTIQSLQKIVLSQRNNHDSTQQTPGWLEAVNNSIHTDLSQIVGGTRLEGVEIGDAGQLRAELLMYDTDWINTLADDVDVVDAAMRRAKKSGLEDIKKKDKSMKLTI